MTISIVGSESPLARELRDQLTSRGVRAEVQLLGGAESTILTEQEGEAALMLPLEAGLLAASELVFCAGSPESSAKAFELAGGRERPVFIDLTGTLEDRANARLRSPLTESEPYAAAAGDIHVIAHPAASVAALLLRRAHAAHPLRHAVVLALEPASERGQSGMNELQQQTTGLLSFRTLEKRVFDAQLGFNVLPRYGEDAPQSLADVEARIDRHLATLLGGVIPMPSLRLVQAPVFHGYSMSFWLDFEKRPDTTALGESLASAQIEIRSPGLDAPSNAGAVGQPGIIAGLIEHDRNHPGAVWLWAVCDNYRIAVDCALDVARDLGVRGPV